MLELIIVSIPVPSVLEILVVLNIVHRAINNYKSMPLAIMVNVLDRNNLHTGLNPVMVYY